MSTAEMVIDDVVSARRNSVADILHRTAKRFPTKTALVGADRTFDYRELDAAADTIAAALHHRGVERGDRIAILSRNNWQFVVLSYATARLGIILVPINFMLKAEEVAYIFDHSEITGLVTEEGLLPVAEQALTTYGRPLAVKTVIGTTQSAEWENFSGWFDEEGRAPEVLVGEDEPIRIMYTSGTESRPKGALLSNRALIAEYTSCIVDGGMSSDDIDLHTLPLYHCAQLDCFLGPDVYLGATSIILPGPDPDAVLSAIETHKVTKFFAPPTVWISLLRSPNFDHTDLSSLHKGYYGASAMPIEVLREIRERLPEVRLWNLYGQTELAPVATILGPEDQQDHPGSAGRPVLNVETAILDDDNVALPVGEVGEVAHRSPQATLGYWRDPEKTAEAFRGGWFHSGDLGYFDPDGRLTIVDRKKDMIKTGGENVASREVEEAIYLHPDVAEVAVFALPHPKWVESVCAVVVPKPGADLDEDAVLAHCAARLAGFKVPKHLVVADSLPKNPSGKVLKRDLRTTFADLAQRER
ncbi:Benzoate-CoA ligase [Rhodococcus wratislaviensis]|uniref:Benzoate-CoA ligase n=1 Tax=Rhodococcus wratislaviensis TaxID=44752 RepID=A0A402C3F3_RHOWR|nr:fatty acyl-CoA synthetase [Rhodococcus wratislaviensis]GCE38119.1 Benzoate-CoA ligase [Rhodococcus wratislaviensis]